MTRPTIGTGIGLAFALALGCSPNTSGNGGTDGEDPSGSGSGSASASDTTNGEGSTGAATCTNADQDTQITFANQGTLVPPMELGFADILGIDVARSGTSELGTVTMPFTTTCNGPVHLWALVWDAVGGVTNENADSLYVTIDDGDEQAWIYGCVTEEGVDQRWRWLPLESWTMTQCNHIPFVVDLPPGEHTIVVRSREGGSGGIDVAAIAGVVISHDPQTDPSPFFPIPDE